MGPERLGKKTSKIGPNRYSVQNEKLTCTYIHKSVLIISCHWHGFGGTRDRFDVIIPTDRIADILTALVRNNTLVYVIHLSNAK